MGAFLLPNLRIKESPQTALSPDIHPHEDLESSIPLSLCSAWRGVPTPKETKGGGTATADDICQEDAGGNSIGAPGADAETMAWCALLQLCLPSVRGVELQGRRLMAGNHG